MTIIHNKYFDEVWGIQLQEPVPPKQSSRKEKNKYFEELAKDYLEKGRKDNWPLKGKFFISIKVSGPGKYVKTADVDNISKQVLDAMKKIVIEDDRFVYFLKATKEESKIAFLSFGIRTLGRKENVDFNQPLHFVV